MANAESSPWRAHATASRALRRPSRSALYAAEVASWLWRNRLPSDELGSRCEACPMCGRALLCDALLLVHARSEWERFGHEVSRTIDVQAISSAVLACFPTRGPLIVGVIRMIARIAPGTECRWCTGRWYHQEGGGPDPTCRYCQKALREATLGRLPPLGMVVAETVRAIENAAPEPTRETLRARLLEWVRAARARGKCPTCRSAKEPCVPTSDGWLCETCVHHPRLAPADWRAEAYAEYGP